MKLEHKNTNVLGKLTKNEIMIILQKFNKSYIDKCEIVTKYENLFEDYDNTNKGKEEFENCIKSKMQKLEQSSNKGMKLTGDKNIDYFVFVKDDSVKIERTDNLLQKREIFSISWENYSKLVGQLIRKNLFMTKQENDVRIFSALLIEKYEGKNLLEIELSSKKKELNTQLLGYFKNLYELCSLSNNLTKLNKQYKIDGLECFKNKVLIDKDYSEKIRKILRYEFDIVPLNSKKVSYLKKLIPAATFIEDIDKVRRKCDISCFVGTIVIYQNREYKVENAEKNIELISINNNSEKLYVSYKQFKEIQNNKKELSFFQKEFEK